MIELDGSLGEGGGALVRVALALSTLTGQEFKVTNIRASRPTPGLKAQHLEAINALKQICGAQTNEINLGTTELWFKPGKIKKGIYEIDIGTAGSISLLLQAMLLPCLFAPGKITLKIKGGTCGKWQASVDYLQNVLLPHLNRFVEKMELKILKRGYFPKGGGLIQLEITPKISLDSFSDFPSFFQEVQAKVPKINFTGLGQLGQIRGIVNLSSELQEKEVGERIKRSAEEELKSYQVPINIRVEYSSAESIGGEIVLWAIFSQEGKIDFDFPLILGGDALIEKGKKSEEIGQEAAKELKEEIEAGNSVDKHLADQLIQFMALLPGSYLKAHLSNHAQTNIYVVERFLPIKLKVKNEVLEVSPQKDL